ncbi:molybdopterin-dependent oxidoreductase [Streptomyces sp. WMMB 322]|uniref:molybdopterin-dependent oxidoreductase n=1 Tax=Streptomyces sp. WMMB 322 TaxID=1286821 RepID=UPI0006E2C1AE|nr:molybdopterin-dependent oxidoreductase [Streptomyces sp. WMMB 322]SCK35531.1 DMSO/TMAO reductase YedYZ, molybdopterin-dependent catalytic subunit [Streptomyces sp. WMMB 322]
MLSGLLAGVAALALAEPVSVAVRPEASPVTAVGGAVIDRTPAAVKDFAVRTFGSQDKLVLQLGIGALLVLFALALGLLALRRRRTGSAGVVVFGLVGASAAVERPGGGPLDAVPSIVSALAGAVVLYLLAGRLAQLPPPARRNAAPADGETPPGTAARPAAPEALRRRGFTLAAAAVAAGSAGAALLGHRLGASRGARAAASRAAVLLPAPRSRAAPVPRGADLGIDGVPPFLTPSKDFYRVDTALTVPRVDVDDWTLRIHGRGVREPLTLGFADLLERGLVERHITLTCVSNQVGGSYTGNASWLGVPLAALLRDAGVRPPSQGGGADQLVARSVDGMTLGSPVETVMDGRDALLAVGMNGEPLPFAHGFPVRMVVPGLYGYVSACKWLRDLELTTFDDYDVYWVRRDWAREAPVKTQSRIDTPRPLSSLKAGTVRVAGVAWAQHRGIGRVEVRVDDGPWKRARLAEEDSPDTWRQWVWEWPAAPGSHRLQVRATGKDGRTQTAERVGTVPDGATGRHSVVVDVT